MMKKVRSLIEKIIPIDALLACCFSVLWNWVAYYGVRYFYGGRRFYDMTTYIEEQIPVLPWTVFIYYAFFPLVGINIFLLARNEKQRLFQYVIADFIGKSICLACFLIVPTTNIRPNITGSDISSVVMRSLYARDPANNLFPSIHCLDSWFVLLFIGKSTWSWKWYKVFTCVLAVAICLSTLTTKQHVVPDVIMGIALAEVAYRLAAMIQKKCKIKLDG